MKPIAILFGTLAALAAAAALITRADNSRPDPKTPAGSAQAAAAKEPAPVVDWLTDFDAARQKARSEGKTLLLDFTGSDWCGWCIKLEQEIFTTPEFAGFAVKHLVLVKVDFPRGKPQSAAEQRQNEQLAARFQVQGFPTLVLLKADGEPLGTLGYMRGGPEPFLKELAAVIKAGS